MCCSRPALGILALLLFAGCAAPLGPARPALELAASGAGNRAELALDGSRAVIAITSERGIGEVVVRHVGGPLPEQIELRLRLAGLEALEVRHAHGTTTVSVSSAAGNTITQTLRAPDGAERALTPADSEWLPLTIEPAQPEPTIPLSDGQFVLVVPGALLDDPSRTITVRWIDFYR